MFILGTHAIGLAGETQEVDSKDQGRGMARFVPRSLRRMISRALERAGYQIRRINPDDNRDFPGKAPYLENPEVGPDNLSQKTDRVDRGENFEWPNMAALNQAVVSLIGDAGRIVELGGGTGYFALEAAKSANVSVVCSEFDRNALSWARENRAHPKVDYIDGAPGMEEGLFDLVVAIEVIEHIADYRTFLEDCVALAPGAIITTPNRVRDSASDTAGPPGYFQHVREWSAGEFYWVLRAFYNKVALYSMPDVNKPDVVPIKITDSRTPIIACCEDPCAPAHTKDIAEKEQKEG